MCTLFSRVLRVASVLALLGRPAAAQVVEYFHLDALGSVRTITSASGTIIEQHDYMPFGEEWCGPSGCTTPPAGQARRFTGKERDTETGLAYFGARYYAASLGRFTTIDPLLSIKANSADPQRWNRYTYVLNNPQRHIDPNGMWPSDPKVPVHQNAINRALWFLSPTDRAILCHQQIVADRAQGSDDSPKHAMRSPRLSVAQAKGEANDYVRGQLEHARAARRRHDQLKAMEYLGNALHTVQDSTSPEHAGFQVWDEGWNPGPNQRLGTKEARRHVVGELFDPGPNSQLDVMTLRTYYLYESDDPLPRDFFGGFDQASRDQ